MTYTPSPDCRQCGARLAKDNQGERCAACQSSDRDRVARAPDVPPEFWTDHQLQAALATRHIGRVIHAYRSHPYHGRHALAQAVVAGWVGITQPQLSRIEGGPSIVHLDKLIQWAQVLGIPEQYLWFRLPAGGSERSETEDMKRRSFFLMTGAAVTSAQLPQAGSAGFAPAEPALAGAVSDLTAVMLTPTTGNAVEPATAQDVTRRVFAAWQLRQRANYEALSRLLPTLLRQAEDSSHRLTGEDQDQAVHVLVHTYNAASSLFKRLGDSALALLAADRAVRCAQGVGDPLLIAAAMYRLANVLLAARRLDDTRTVALQAASLIDPGKMQTPRSLAMWGGLLLTAAVATARNTDESGAWELMGEARAASLLLGTDYADTYAIFGPTNVAIHGVQVAVELRNGRDAVRRSQQVNPGQLPESLIERRGQFLIDLAHGHVLERDDQAAVATLLRADHIAPQEVRLSADVHGLTRTLLDRERTGAAPGLRELADRLRLASQE